MATAANLPQAASQAFGLVSTKWSASTLKAAMTTFKTALRAIFPTDGTPAIRSVSNWLVIGAAIDTDIPVDPTRCSYITLNQACRYVFQICWAAENARTSTPQRITTAQATAVLAAFNAAW